MTETVHVSPHFRQTNSSVWCAFYFTLTAQVSPHQLVSRAHGAGRQPPLGCTSAGSNFGHREYLSRRDEQNVAKSR